MLAICPIFSLPNVLICKEEDDNSYGYYYRYYNRTGRQCLKRERLQFQPYYANYSSRVPPSPLFGFLLEIPPLRHNDYLQEHSFTLLVPNNNYILIQCNNCYIQHSNRRVHSCDSFRPAQHPQYLFLM